MLIWPIDALGYIIANGQEAMTAADRVYEVLDTEPSIVDRPTATAARPGPRYGVRCASRASSSPTRARPSRSCAGSTCEVEPGETLAIVGATGIAARPRWCRWSPGSST